jgi:hypothetical protein
MAAIVNLLSRPIVLIWVCYFCLIEIISWFTASGPLCIFDQSGGETEGQQDNQEDCPTFHVGLVRLAAGVVGLIDRYHDVVTAAATVIIGIFTFTLWRATSNLWESSDRQIRLARDDFNATHRPWIPIIKTTLNFGVRWAQGNAILGIDVFCKNTGNSPARRVSLAAAIFPYLVNDDIPKEMTKIQAAHRTAATRDLIEHTCFPGMPDELRLSRAFVILASTIADLKDFLGDPATEMVPVIVGAVEYYFSFGEPTPHYTPFVYHLWRTDKEGNTRETIKLDGSNVEADDLILVPLINAGDPT